MAAELIWTEEALDDIDAIAEFIARDSPHHAHRVVASLFDLGDEAGEQPLIGSFRNCNSRSSESASSIAIG